MKKLTISIEENIYDGLHKFVGQGKISHFINELVKPHLINTELDNAYKAMAQDTSRENLANEWSENLIGDMHDPSRSDHQWN